MPPKLRRRHPSISPDPRSDPLLDPSKSSHVASRSVDVSPPSLSNAANTTGFSCKRFGSLRKASQWILQRSRSIRANSISRGVTTPTPTLSPHPSQKPSPSKKNKDQPSPSRQSYPSISRQPAMIPGLVNQPFPPKFSSSSTRDAVLAIPKDHQFAPESVDFCRSFTYWRYARLLPEAAALPHSSEQPAPIEQSVCSPSDPPNDPPSTLSPEETAPSASPELTPPPSEPEIDASSPLILSPENYADLDDIYPSGHSSWNTPSFSQLRVYPLFGDNPFELLSDCGLYVPKAEGQPCRTSLPLPLETIISTTCWNISPKYKRYGVLLHNGLDSIRVS